MSEEELDLFQFSAIHGAEFRAGPAQIMRSKVIQFHPLCAPSNDVPDDVLGNPFGPWRPLTAYHPENPARRDHGGRHPAIDSGLDPKWHRHSPNVTALANQIHDGP